MQVAKQRNLRKSRSYSANAHITCATVIPKMLTGNKVQIFTYYKGFKITYRLNLHYSTYKRQQYGIAGGLQRIKHTVMEQMRAGGDDRM